MENTPTTQELIDRLNNEIRTRQNALTKVRQTQFQTIIENCLPAVYARLQAAPEVLHEIELAVEPSQGNFRYHCLLRTKANAFMPYTLTIDVGYYGSRRDWVCKEVTQHDPTAPTFTMEVSVLERIAQQLETIRDGAPFRVGHNNLGEYI